MVLAQFALISGIPVVIALVAPFARVRPAAAGVSLAVRRGLGRGRWFR
ncbi:hypothetical protein [Streptomyces aureocirculatus]|nr:hypothetical protein [Streptomyces aureocirculatus]